MAFQAKPRANFFSPLFGVSDARVFSIPRNLLLAESLYPPFRTSPFHYL
jgi:hypothetical protein